MDIAHVLVCMTPPGSLLFGEIGPRFPLLLVLGKYTKHNDFWKVLGRGLPGGGNVPRGSIIKLSRGSRLPYAILFAIFNSQYTAPAANMFNFTGILSFYMAAPGQIFKRK